MSGAKPAYKTASRLAAYRKGMWAELWTAFYLIVCGYRIVKWRYKTPLGEIDLIARRGQTLVFIEVKARKGRVLGLDAVPHTSWQRIARAADHFYASHQRQVGKIRFWRYDLVVVTPWRLPYHQRDTYRP